MTNMTAVADEIERLMKEATALPWRSDKHGFIWMTDDDFLSFETKSEEASCGWPETNLIIALRNNAPAIVTALREAEKYKTALKKIASSDGKWVCEPGDATRPNYIGSLRDVARTALGEP